MSKNNTIFVLKMLVLSGGSEFIIERNLEI